MSLQFLDILIGFVTVMLGASLIITIITQLISGALGLRGSNLRWGITTLLERAAPNLDKNAKAITQAVLNHQLISDSTFSKFGSCFKRWRLATAIRRKELIEILEQLKKNPEWAASLNPRMAEIKTFIEEWFDGAMDRVSQRFAMTMRFWTVAVAILLAFGLRLDAVALLKKLSRDQAVRAKLVAGAEAVIHQTENVIGANGATNIFRLALDQLRTTAPEATKYLTNPPPLLNQETANLWLRTQLVTNAQMERLMADYRQLVSSNVLARAPELMGSIGVVHDELERAGLVLVPDYKAIHWKDYSPLRLNFWGMLAAAGLLSLGAPFWYNGLKSLMSLRPVLAARVRQETEGGTSPN